MQTPYGNVHRLRYGTSLVKLMDPKQARRSAAAMVAAVTRCPCRAANLPSLWPVREAFLKFGQGQRLQSVVLATTQGEVVEAYYSRCKSPKKLNTHTRLSALSRVPRAGLEPVPDGGSSQILEGKLADSEALQSSEPGPHGSSAESTVTLSHDSINKALENARAEWLRGADPDALREALLEIVRRLESLPREK